MKRTAQDPALTGGCQCGAVRFRAAALLDNPHLCHCRMCQKATGGFFAALVGVPRPDLAWTRGTPASFASSAGHARGFCRDCGTPLYFQRLAGGHVSLCIATFDDPSGIALAFELGHECRLPQVDQIGAVDRHALDAELAEQGAQIAASNRQHPDHDTDRWPPPSG